MWITIDDNHVIISNTLWNFSWNSNLYDLYALFNGPCEKFLIKTRVVFVYKECKECWSCEKKKKGNVLFNSMYRERIEKSIAERHFLKRRPPEVRPLLSLTKTNRVRGETRYTIIATFQRSNGLI